MRPYSFGYKVCMILGSITYVGVYRVYRFKNIYIYIYI